MKNLLEIAKVATKKKVKKIEIFDEWSLKVKNSKFNEFYEDLTQGVYKNDRDAAAKLYDCSPKDARYRQLKSRFRRRLLNTIFFLDVNKPSASNYDRARFTCHKEWTLVKILQDNNAHNSAKNLAKSILTTALKYRLSEIIVNCSRMLRQFAAESNEVKQFEEYDLLIKSHNEILEAETRSEEYYQRVIMDYYRPLDKQEDLNDRIESFSNILLSLSESFDSPLVFYNMFLVWAMRYEIDRNYEALLEVCERAENYINDNPDFYQENRLIDFYTKKMSAYLHLGKFLPGQINAENCLKRFQEGSKPWFAFMEYYLLLALHTNHDIQALAIFNRSVGNKNFHKLDTKTKDKWVLFEAIIQFLLSKGSLASKLVSTKKRQGFSIDKFVNMHFNYDADQKSLMVFSIVFQVAFLLEHKQYNKSDELIDVLQNMANRNLKKDIYFRAIQFIRLILQFRKAEYQKEELRNTEKYLDRLHEHPFSYRGVLSQFEPIPYEKLWNLFITRLS